MNDIVIALDQGTTSTRAIAFDADLKPIATAQSPLRQSYPGEGMVEHDPLEILDASYAVLRGVIAELAGPERIAAIGITNQRETTVVWDRTTGAPIYPAIVWQDRRTASACDAMRHGGMEGAVRNATGLLLDPYFSATKVAWILDKVPGARVRAETGALCFGTIDSWLLFKLCGGVHATDPSNASRTLLYDLGAGAFSPRLASVFGVPQACLPMILPSFGLFGFIEGDLFGREIPVTGVLGDQQAALLGHGAVAPGDAKVTFGTGAFLMLNTGAARPISGARLLTTVAWRDEADVFALEGSVFSAGATVDWMRTGLDAFDDPATSSRMAESVQDTGGVCLVPAFTGLGAPHWSADARGALLGLGRDTRLPHIVRAGLESIGHTTADILDAFAADGAEPQGALKVDGGVGANAFAMQFLADISARVVERPIFSELTARGAAMAARIGAGLDENVASASARARAGEQTIRFEPAMRASDRAAARARWTAAVATVLDDAKRRG
jgi:glycerol kinase